MTPVATSRQHARPRLDAVDAARAISILLVVLLHARIVLGGVGAHAGVVASIDDVAGHLRIPLFFAASGLFAARWASASWRELFGGRLAPLTWVFLAWQPAVLVYKLAESWLLHDEFADRWGWQVAQLLTSVARPVGELWFLWALAVFLVLAKLTVRVPLALRLGIPAAASYAWIAMVEPVLGRDVREGMGAGWDGVVKYFVFFLAAVVFSVRIRAFVAATPRWAAALVFAGWLALTIAVIQGGVPVPWVRWPLFVLGAVAGFALGRMLDPIRPLCALGRRTLPVYVAHLPIIVAIVVVLDAAGLRAIVVRAPSIAVVVLAGLATVGALALHRALVRTRSGGLLYAPPDWFAALGRPARPGARAGRRESPVTGGSDRVRRP